MLGAYYMEAMMSRYPFVVPQPTAYTLAAYGVHHSFSAHKRNCCEDITSV